MRVVEVRQESQLESLRAEWNNVLRDSASKTIFLTWEWVSAWWSAYGNAGDLRILLALDESDTLRGIAPLRKQMVRNYGRSFSALSFIGDGSNDSDYLDFVVARGFETPVMEAFRSHWYSETETGALLLLNEIPAGSPNFASLKGFGERKDSLWTEADVPCACVSLPDTWEDYLGSLRSRFRTKVRSVLRNLEGRPEVSFGFFRTWAQVQSVLPVLFELHTRRWAQEAKPGVFGWDRKREFYFSVSRAFLEQKWLRICWLKWKEKIVACQFGFVYGNSYFQLQEGYNPDCQHWNVGMGLRAWSIRKYLEEGVRQYDFLAGVDSHKTDWGSEIKLSKRVVLARANLATTVFARGPKWAEAAKDSIKKVLPEKALAARRARLERQRIAAFNGEQAGRNSRSSELLRSVASNCYFYLRLPTLAQRVSRQYQISVSPNGGRPKLGLQRREQPTARILYYHRVNDENDPFSPAISTTLFEQEMRILSRHHKVVSLSEMLIRLAGESSEPVIVVTFDDGYQDNFHNAFPILRRYGLPATIFLTTGGIDQTEALWFEQLAQAIKRTSKEFIDLEMDLPRRLWMRTPTERLEANDRLFRLLREMPDAERRQWLDFTFQQLAVGAERDSRNRMLTWDQIRLMEKGGITFGGHTVTHPFLSRLPQEQAAWEVGECKRRIEEELQCPADYFAYPNGRNEDIVDSNRELLRNSGYRAAVTTIWGMNYPSTDLMTLRRGGPWETSQANFAAKLDWYQLRNE